MTREEIARSKARDIVRLTLEQNPHTPAFVLSERAIDTYIESLVGINTRKDLPTRFRDRTESTGCSDGNQGR